MKKIQHWGKYWRLQIDGRFESVACRRLKVIFILGSVICEGFWKRVNDKVVYRLPFFQIMSPFVQSIKYGKYIFIYIFIYINIYSSYISILEVHPSSFQCILFKITLISNQCCVWLFFCIILRKKTNKQTAELDRFSHIALPCEDEFIFKTSVWNSCTNVRVLSCCCHKFCTLDTHNV